MKNLKESFSLYTSNFGRIFALMLPAILIGYVSAFPEIAFGMDKGIMNIPTDPVTWFLIILAMIIFITAIFWNQFAFSEFINNRSMGTLECYKRGWKRLATILEKLKNLPKIFGKKLLIVFIAWVVINGTTAFIAQTVLKVDFWLMKTIMGTLNLLILLPFFHIYGFFLYQDQMKV